MTPKQINSTRKAFRVTVAALTIADAVGKEYGGAGLDERGRKMLELHQRALEELEKENPSFDVVAALFAKMEMNAGTAKHEFAKGGIVSGKELEP